MSDLNAGSGFRLSRASLSLKTLVTFCVLGLSVGYSVSLLQIYNRSHFNKEQAIEHYRGASDSNEDSLAVPQSDTSLISIAHVHTFSQPAILGMMGLMLVFTGLREGTKSFWIALSFVGSFAKNLSPWLIRDVSSHFIYLMYFGGGVMFLSFGVMALAILKETWSRPKPTLTAD
jgi:hypothetical protein